MDTKPPARQKPPPDPEADLYPPSPREMPPLTLVTGAYRIRVILVLFSLFVFLVLYLALVAGSACLLHWSWEMPWPRGRAAIGKIGAILGSLMLFLFFLKGLFKRHRPDTGKYMRISENEQPTLFAFVRRLCREAGSSSPRAIYLSPEVNAAVFYPRSLFALVLPVRKNLVVGLGLVNQLNLSELKAVLAHEFGHFAQSSMKLGQYVYVVNQVIHDMVFGRDFWDDLLVKWRSIDLRLSFPAWALSLIVWLLRHLLGLVYRAINILNLSLSRQMEYNADLHAVRLTGSDALISGLWKTERGAIAFQGALSDVASLAEHGKYSADFFYHQQRSLETLERVLREQASDAEETRVLGTPYEYGKTIHFPSEGQEADWWQTHPTNHQREVNAKRVYVAQPPDDRPAWRLVDSDQKVRRALSLLVYREFLEVSPSPSDLLPPEEVEELIDEERQEMKQAEHYFGLYDDRTLEPGNIGALAREIDGQKGAGRLDADALRGEAAAWTGDTLRRFMESYRRIDSELKLLAGLDSGEIALRGGTLSFRGKQVTLGDVNLLLRQVGKEREKLDCELATADRAIFRYFYYLSGESEEGGAEKRAELVRRYEFLLAIQKIISVLNKAEGRIVPVLHLLQQGGRLSEEDVGRVRHTFSFGWTELSKVVKETESVLLPKLSHLAEDATVRSFVLPQKLVRRFDADTLDGEWISAFLRQFQQVIGRLRKLHFKNLGLLLRLQEGLDPQLFTAPER